MWEWKRIETQPKLHCLETYKADTGKIFPVHASKFNKEIIALKKNLNYTTGYFQTCGHKDSLIITLAQFRFLKAYLNQTLRGVKLNKIQCW